MTQTKKIVEYGVFDFCRSVQEAFEEGYRFDLSKNETCPMVFGTMYEVLMLKPEVEMVISENESVDQTTDTTADSVPEQVIESVNTEDQSVDQTPDVPTVQVDTTADSVIVNSVRRGRKAIGS